MRELKLKYIIELVSDLSRKSKSDEVALTKAQERIQKEIAKTNTQLGLTEKVLLRIGGVGSASAERQANYLAKLALRYQDVRKSAESASRAMEKVAAIGAGAAAGAYTAGRMIEGPMDYSLRLAHMANTAFSDRNVAGRIAGKGALDAAITAALRVGGGKRDDAAATLEAMIASGAVPVEAAIKLLPSFMKGSTASGADATALANIGIRSMQSFGLTVDQVPMALDMAMAAGQAGGFELKDMARWLPQAMAAGSMSGLSGVEGFRRLLGTFQASVITAGSKDEAGNNVVNLLGKINSQDTAKDFEKQGIDLSARLAKARSNGVNSIDAFIELVDEIASKDKKFVDLKRKLNDTSDVGERRSTLESMAAILEGKAIGFTVQDRQAVMGLIAERNNRAYVASVMDKTRNSAGSMGTAFGVISQETAVRQQMAGNDGLIASQELFARLAPVLNKVFDGASYMAREFPTLTLTVVGATAALSVFSAALGASGLIGMLTGRGGTGAAAGTLLGGAIGRAAPLAAAAGVWGAGIWAGWEVGNWLGDSYVESVRNRQGVQLSGNALARSGMALPRGPGLPGAPDFLSLTGPGQFGGAGAGVPFGQGKLDVDVKVTDDRVSASTRVRQELPGFRINPGSTNPGSVSVP